MLSLISSSVFYEISTLLALISVLGVLGLWVRQPLIVCFILVGLIAGPGALDLIHSDEHINLFSKIGVAILLFLVGLKLDLNLIKTTGPVALATGLGQIVFTSGIGYFLCLALGFSALSSLYIAVALTFSSTIIIVKILSDKKELDSLHGRIAVGFLIVQDLFVILSMVILSTLGIGDSAHGHAAPWMSALLGGGALIVGTLLFVRYLATPLMLFISHSFELMLIFAICLAMVVSSITHFLGFGQELGGLIAGVSLASTPMRDAIAARLGSIRDFLLLFFFLMLGVSFDLESLGGHLLTALVLSLFILIGNPLIVMVIMGFMGYRKRTGFLAGLTVAQISEFSLIFMAMGLTLGHVSSQEIQIVTLVGMMTIALCSYMLIYSSQLYNLLEPFLDIFERTVVSRLRHVKANLRYDIVIFGMGYYGQQFYDALHKHHKILCIDFDPSVVKKYQRKIPGFVFGDMGDLEFLTSLNFRDVRWCLSTLPSQETGLTGVDPRFVLLDHLKTISYKGKIMIRADHRKDIQAFSRRVDLVMSRAQSLHYYIKKVMGKKR